MSDYPIALSDGTVAFSYSYLVPPDTDQIHRRATYDESGRVVEFDTDLRCWASDSAHDGAGGCSVLETPTGPEEVYVQHYLVDGTAAVPPPGTLVAPPSALQGHLAMLSAPERGAYEVYLLPLDPAAPDPTEPTTPRAAVVQRYADDGTRLWEVRVDAADGPKGDGEEYATLPIVHASTPSGRVITSWSDLSAGPPRCFLQALDATGEILGPPGGQALNGPYAAICTTRWPPAPIADEDGVIVLWTTGTEGEDLAIYAMRFDWTLRPQWLAPVLVNCDPLVAAVQVVTDGAGGVVVLWLRRLDYTTYGWYLQRLRADGTLGWDG